MSAAANGRRLLLRESVRVPFATVDDDDDVGKPTRAAPRDPSSGSRRRDDLPGLPEDALATGRQGREDELGPVLARPLQDDVDRDASPPTDGDRHLLDDFGIGWPAGFDPSAEDAARPRPRVTDLEDQAAVDGPSDEVGEPGIRVRVPRDDEVHGDSLRPTRREVHGRHVDAALAIPSRPLWDVRPQARRVSAGCRPGPISVRLPCLAE
jgi:hypothetical protein